MSRRSVLCVPASEPRKVAKAVALGADEVVVDLEDAVSVAMKNSARETVDSLVPRPSGRLAVRINALGTSWAPHDIEACAANPAVTSIVVPKAEDPAAIVRLATHLDRVERPLTRATPLRIQLLIESAIGVQNAAELARASKRLDGLVIGYADLSASIGRRIEASWQFAQDAVIFAARAAGIDAIDGPQLTVEADDMLERAAATAQSLGFDGKWVIHPAQIEIVQRAFTPSAAEMAEAAEILSILKSAAERGVGAVELRGRMLDEALAARARRTMARI